MKINFKAKIKAPLIIFSILLFIVISGCQNNNLSNQNLSGSKTKDETASAVPPLPDEALGIFVDGSYAYLADYRRGLIIIDITNINSLQEISSCSTSAEANDVFISGDYAYMACANMGLDIINIKDKNNPKKIASLPYQENYSGYSRKIFYQNDTVYTADSSEGLRIIDVKDNDNPVIADIIKTDEYAYDVFIEDNYLYILQDRSGLYIYELKNNAANLIGHCKNRGLSQSIYISGDFAYIADYNAGILIVDIENKTDPKIIGQYDGIDNAVAVYAENSIVYAADYDMGLVLIDITDKSGPSFITSYDIGKTNDLTPAGDYIFAAGENGITAIKKN